MSIPSTYMSRTITSTGTTTNNHNININSMIASFRETNAKARPNTRTTKLYFDDARQYAQQEQQQQHQEQAQEDHYSILGLDRKNHMTITKKEIKAAYRALARRYHPDVNVATNASDLFKELNGAYEVLSDEILREQYDNEYYMSLHPQDEQYYNYNEQQYGQHQQQQPQHDVVGCNPAGESSFFDMGGYGIGFGTWSGSNDIGSNGSTGASSSNANVNMNVNPNSYVDVSRQSDDDFYRRTNEVFYQAHGGGGGGGGNGGNPHQQQYGQAHNGYNSVPSSNDPYSHGYNVNLNSNAQSRNNRNHDFSQYYHGDGNSDNLASPVSGSEASHPQHRNSNHNNRSPFSAPRSTMSTATGFFDGSVGARAFQKFTEEQEEKKKNATKAKTTTNSKTKTATKTKSNKTSTRKASAAAAAEESTTNSHTRHNARTTQKNANNNSSERSSPIADDTAPTNGDGGSSTSKSTLDKEEEVLENTNYKADDEIEDADVASSEAQPSQSQAPMVINCARNLKSIGSVSEEQVDGLKKEINEQIQNERDTNNVNVSDNNDNSNSDNSILEDDIMMEDQYQSSDYDELELISEQQMAVEEETTNEEEIEEEQEQQQEEEEVLAMPMAMTINDDLSIHMELTVEPMTAFFGGVQELYIPAVVCTAQCYTCDGTGSTGTGTYATSTEIDDCSTCHGQGRVWQSKTLEVKVPAGVTTGTVLLVKGNGHAATQAASEADAGDLYLTIVVPEKKSYGYENIHNGSGGGSSQKKEESRATTNQKQDSHQQHNKNNKSGGGSTKHTHTNTKDSQHNHKQREATTRTRTSLSSRNTNAGRSSRFSSSSSSARSSSSSFSAAHTVAASITNSILRNHAQHTGRGTRNEHVTLSPSSSTSTSTVLAWPNMLAVMMLGKFFLH
jgi:DnaJ-class molecular chaperone